MKAHLNPQQKKNLRNRAGGVTISGPAPYNARRLLGHIAKVHGHEGIVTIRLERTFTEKITEMESVFLEIEGKLVPFIITESEYDDSGILKLKFEGYDSIEKVSQFTGCRIFLNSEKEEDITKMDFRGFKVYLKDNTLAGTIMAIIENPGQLIINVETENGKEILIPFHEDFIIKIDKKKKVIQMDIPEGLTEIN